MYLHLPESLREALDERAQSDGTSLTAVVIAALQEYLHKTQ